MVVRSFNDSVERQPKELNYAHVPRFPTIKLERDNVLYNVVTSESGTKKNADGTCWRDSKEKSIQFP